MQVQAPQGTARQFITITPQPSEAGGPTDTEPPSLLLNSQTVSSVVLSVDATTVTIRTLSGDTHRITGPQGTLKPLMRWVHAALENPCPITLPPGTALHGAGRL